MSDERDELVQDIRTCPAVGSYNLAESIAEHLHKVGYRKTPVRALLGAAPDFTGGLSVDEYMDEQRGRGQG